MTIEDKENILGRGVRIDLANAFGLTQQDELNEAQARIVFHFINHYDVLDKISKIEQVLSDGVFQL